MEPCSPNIFDIIELSESPVDWGTFFED